MCASKGQRAIGTVIGSPYPYVPELLSSSRVNQIDHRDWCASCRDQTRAGYRFLVGSLAWYCRRFNSANISVLQLARRM